MRSFVILWVLLLFDSGKSIAQSSIVKSVLPKTVKIVGSGGLRGLEAYQSGMIISPHGHVLTSWSYVLDGESSTVTTNDGERFQCKLVGHDARLEIAILKIEADGLPFFEIGNSVDAQVGTPILAFTNSYGVATGNEPVSVQRGVVSAKTNLAARRGSWRTPYTDEVFMVDAITSNPGSAGGALTDCNGQLLGLIGKESRDARTGQWLNYAVPIEKLRDSVNRIIEGTMQDQINIPSRPTSEPMTAEMLGFSLVPNVLRRTPPFVEAVRPDTPAFNAGVLPDDLIVEIDGLPSASCRDVEDSFGRIDRDSSVALTLQRGSEFLSVELSLLEQKQ